MYNRDFVDRVHKEVSLEGFISRYVSLKKRGNRMVGLCPFHSEKTPSFSVSPELKLYHCFGCQKSGDIFRFVMDYDNVDFNRAKEILADYSGIPLTVATNANSDLYDLNKSLVKFYHNYLFSPEGKAALDYLHERKLTDSDIRTFQLGFAPDSFDTVSGILKKENRSVQGLKLGILKEGKHGGSYDFFRGRVMFPIRDRFGKVAGFGGRVLEGKEAKYINSPASAIYDKGKMFYNLDLAGEEIRKKKYVLVVEGYLDVIGLFSRDIRNVVAPLGTALTPSQVRILKNYTDRVIFMMDGDQAGKNAARRGCEICLNEGVESSVLLLETGKDPFDLSREMDTAGLLDLIEKASSASDFLITLILDGIGINSSPEEKKRAINRLYEFVAVMNREIDRQTYLAEAASRLGIRTESVTGDFIREKGSKTGSPQADKYTQVKKEKSGSVVQCERKIMAMLIAHPELFEYSGELEKMEFQDEDSSVIWDFLYTKLLNREEVRVGDLGIIDFSKNLESVVAPFLLEEQENAPESLAGTFKELILRQKIFVLSDKMEEVAGDKTITDEMERFSKIAYYKTEKEKLLEYIRKLN